MLAWVRVGGVQAQLLTYNGLFPGPVIRIREGERLRLRFTNRLQEPTNLHFHGMHIDPAVDNPFLEIPPGESLVYEFVVPEGSAGLFWYHPHVHGLLARQLFAGLAGAIVVEGPADATPELRAAEEHVIVLKDLSLRDGRPEPHKATDWADGKEGEMVLVNGRAQPVLDVTRPLLRLRFVNASNARFYKLKLEGHPWHLIGTDGGLIEKPVAYDELILVPGERADVLVRLERQGEFRLLNVPYSRGGVPGITEPQPLMTLRATTAGRAVKLPERLVTLERLASASAVTRSITFGMFLINGLPFDPQRVDFIGQLGDVEVWEIGSVGDMDHPFHIHTYSFQVLSRNGVPEPFVAWRDTIDLRPRDVVRVALPLRGFAGRTVFHCHIAEHADRGMMAVLEVRPGRQATPIEQPRNGQSGHGQPKEDHR